MSSIGRSLSGPALAFDLSLLAGELRAEDAYTRSGRSARTLAKSGRLRTTLMALRAEGEVGTHRADSPITLYVVGGAIRFRSGGAEHRLGQGQLLVFGPHDAEDIRAAEDSVVLLTVAAEGDDYAGDAAQPSR